MVSIDIVTCTSAADLRAAVTPIWHYFGRVPVDEQITALRRVLAPNRVHTARDGDRVVGAAGSFAFDLAVPGGRVSAAGVTIVAVLPTHRRRGVLRQMMRAQLDACHARGEPVAYLWATEDTIYERFGYGIAAFSAEIDVPRGSSRLSESAAAPARATLLAPAEAETLIAPIYEGVAKMTPGMFARTPEWWQARTLADPPWRRANSGELQCAVLELDAAPAAYALYRMTPNFDRGVQMGAVQVVEAIGNSPEATRAVWRYLLDIDWMARVTASMLPVDHPLLLLVAEPRRLRFSLREGVWVRLVDVGAALSARCYQCTGSVVIEVADGFCPWNNGRWRIAAGNVERTDAAADLRCGISALGSAYLGGFTWGQLSRALRVAELAPRAAARADAIFRTPYAPWCPEIF
jgi:predicted acetyltransferase